MDDPSRQGAERAQYDLDTADAMRTGKLPPRTHHLARLAEIAAVGVDEDQVDFLRQLSTYYIPTRYPEDMADLALDVKAEKAQRVLSQSREFMQWLSSTSQ